MPSSALCGFTGIHTMPPDQALVPPTVSAFSNSPTLAPSAAARTAADRAAAPVPRTTTSKLSAGAPRDRTGRVSTEPLHKEPSHSRPGSLASIQQPGRLAGGAVAGDPH